MSDIAQSLSVNVHHTVPYIRQKKNNIVSSAHFIRSTRKHESPENNSFFFLYGLHFLNINIASIPAELENGRQLLDVKTWLTNQSEENKIWEETEKMTLPPSDADIEIEISRLIKKLQQKTCINSRRELTVEKLQIGNVLLKSLFEKDDLTNPYFSKRLKKLLLYQCRQSAEILESQKELSTLQAELDDLKDLNQKIITQNRELMNFLDNTNKNLESMNKHFDSKKEEALILEELQIKKKQNNAIKYIMQTLIIASGVNWAEDPELLDTMIQLGIELQA
ncbi:CENPH [Acanthosepion pharaonis]|uniref:CENPH n=1 Tax=Acanthosepion pharaonis TaxID=158019 RepID=A0A812EP94_ACAPH|nr:CENPH [Sepia pharaonis]